MIVVKKSFANVVSFSLLSLLPALVCTQDSTFDRVIALPYANTGGAQIPYNDTYFFQQIDRIQPPVTALVPFLLNVGNPSQYDKILRGLKKRNIAITPGIGGHQSNDIDSPIYKKIAKAYRKYTDRIELENMQSYVDGKNGLNKVNAMIDYLNNTLGFQHIQLNPWPRAHNQGGINGIVPFSNPAVDSTILQITLNFNRKTLKIKDDPTNWYPNLAKIKEVRSVAPTASILINYENAPQEEALAKLSQSQQIAAFQTTLKQIQKDDENLHWAPPFSQNYDPIVEGTWDFIIQQLSSM